MQNKGVQTINMLPFYVHGVPSLETVICFQYKHNTKNWVMTNKIEIKYERQSLMVNLENL